MLGHLLSWYSRLQICGGFPDAVARCCQLLDDCVDVDFVVSSQQCVSSAISPVRSASATCHSCSG